jgi:Ser/Thr protein kinase RdoA (MazF antagonist)
MQTGDATLFKISGFAVSDNELADVVVRVPGNYIAPKDIEEDFKLARYLYDNGTPVIEPIGTELIVCDGRPLFISRAVKAVDDTPTPQELGALLARFHAVPLYDNSSNDLRPLDPFRHTEVRLPQVAKILKPSKYQAVVKKLQQNKELWAKLENQPFTVVAHGDYYAGNVIPEFRGEGMPPSLRICDFERSGLGFPELDLLRFVQGEVHFKRRKEILQQVVSAYIEAGGKTLDVALARRLLDIIDLNITIGVGAYAAAGDEWAKGEFPTRLQSTLLGEGAKWTTKKEWLASRRQ